MGDSAVRNRCKPVAPLIGRDGVALDGRQRRQAARAREGGPQLPLHVSRATCPSAAATSLIVSALDGRGRVWTGGLAGRQRARAPGHAHGSTSPHATAVLPWRHGHSGAIQFKLPLFFHVRRAPKWPPAIGALRSTGTRLPTAERARVSCVRLWSHSRVRSPLKLRIARRGWARPAERPGQLLWK